MNLELIVSVEQRWNKNAELRITGYRPNSHGLVKTQNIEHSVERMLNFWCARSETHIQIQKPTRTQTVVTVCVISNYTYTNIKYLERPTSRKTLQKDKLKPTCITCSHWWHHNSSLWSRVYRFSFGASFLKVDSGGAVGSLSTSSASFVTCFSALLVTLSVTCFWKANSMKKTFSLLIYKIR